MNTGFATPFRRKSARRATARRATARRTVATHPAPAQSETAKTLTALRMATGPGYMAGGINDRMLTEATRR